MRRLKRKNTRKLQKYEIVTIVIFLILVCLLGYILIAGIFFNGSSQTKTAYAIEKGSDATPTPTPFQPAPNPQISNQGDATGNSRESATEETPTQHLYTKPEGQVNILLLGSDLRPDDGGFRTDIILWVSLNPQDEFVSVISFPRDLYVSVPGWGEQRINTPFQFGGFDLLADTFETNFGIRPDHYVMIDFVGFKTVIDNLGGINVETRTNLTDTCAKWINPSGICSVGPGTVHMDGEVALWYARSRYSTSDVDRAERAQEVIKAIFRRLMSLDVLLKADDLYDAYINYVDTDLKLGDVLPLLPLANQIQTNGDIRQYVVGFDQTTDWITAGGAMVLLPHYEEIQQIMIEALMLK